MVQRAGAGHPGAQHRRPAGFRAQRRDLPSGGGEHLPGARFEGERGAAYGDRFAREVGEYGGELIAVQVQPDGVPGAGDQPQDGGGLTARGGPAARLGDHAVGPQPGGDLADGLRGQPDAVGELQPADALLAGRAQQPEHQCGVVAAQGGKVGARVAGEAAVGEVVAAHPPIVRIACTLATPLLKWEP